MTVRVLRKSLLVALVAGGLLLAGGAWLLGSMLLSPVLHSVPCPPNFLAQPVLIPGPQHAVAGWWMDLGGESPVVLLLHGIRSDRSSMVPRARRLITQGFSVLLIDLQGHGETPGEMITLGAKESGDVDSSLKWIQKTVPARKVGVIGCSLGGAAMLLRSQTGGVDAVVLEAVFPRITQAVENRIRIRLGPLAPVLSPLLLMQFQPRLQRSPSDLEPIRFIHRLSVPVLVVAGSDDRHTTLSESRELYDAAAEPKEMYVLTGAGHEDFLTFDPSGYESRVIGFLRRHLGPSPRRDETPGTDSPRLPSQPLREANP